MDTPTAVGSSGDSEWKASEAKRKAEEEAVMNHPVNVNGHQLQLKDLYSSHYDAKDFHQKLGLMDKVAASASGRKSPMDMSPERAKQINSPGSGEPDDDDVEDRLFKGSGVKQIGSGQSQKP